MDTEQSIEVAAASDGLKTLTYAIYALHAFSALSGILSSAFVVTAFLTGWPSILAVIVNYIKRGATYGTILDSHFGWQIRTFWYALLWFMVAGLLAVTIIGIPLAILLAWLTGLWVLYRIIRGWLRLMDYQGMPE